MKYHSYQLQAKPGDIIKNKPSDARYLRFFLILEFNEDTQAFKFIRLSSRKDIFGSNGFFHSDYYEFLNETR